MMTLQELKKEIENKTLGDSSLIIKCDNNFVIHQYINEIAKFKNKSLVFVETLDELFNRNPFLVYNDIYVFETDNLDKFNYDLGSITNSFIICKKTKLDCIEVPKLEQWQIKDFALSNLSLKETDIDWLCSQCKYDIHKLDNEIQRLKLFDNQETIFKQFIYDGIYNDLSSDNIFSITNAIENKDYNTLSKLYEKIELCDVEPLGVVTTLYNAFKKMLIIITTKYPTEENTGIKSNQIWALKNIAKCYTGQQILDIVKFLSDIQEKLVLGVLPADIVRDYVILNILKLGR